MSRVWLIAGPTASGKSALALRLARELGGEVVNADSMQLYRDLRVLSAGPTANDEALVPHHLYGVADAAEGWSVGRWLRAAETVLAEIARRDRAAVVVGGTGLYFRALTRGLADIPPIPQAVRAAAAGVYEELGEAGFRERLRAKDPEAESRIALGDRQRLVRAYEIAVATDRPLSAWQADAGPAPLAKGRRALVIDPPRPELYARCDVRLEAMVQAGALEEVQALLARGLDASLPAMKAVGVREFGRHVSGELSVQEALALAQQQTRRYAKRQATWFRHQTSDWPRVESLDPETQWSALTALAG